MKKNLILYLVLTLLITLPNISYAYTVSYYNTSSALSEGKWIKVETDTTGIYQISYEQLRNWGFSDPSKVCVYGYGALKCTDNEFNSDYQDDLPQTAMLHTDDERILFYAEGDVRASLNTDGQATITRNYYDTKAYYFLSDSKPAQLIPESSFAGTNSTTTTDWNYCIELIEREVQNPGDGGAFFHGKILKAGESEDFRFLIRDYASNKGVSGLFRYEAALKTATAIKIPITVSDNVNILTNSPSNSGLTSSPVRLYVSAYGNATFNSTDALPLNETYATFTLTIPETFSGTYAAIDKTYIVYPRQNKLGKLPEIMMNYKSMSTGQTFKVSDTEKDTQIWNVTDPANIFKYEVIYDADTRSALASFSSSSNRVISRLIAFQPSKAHREVKFVEESAHQNLHGAECPDMIIVTTAENESAAQDLAQIHREYQGFDVLVVRQEDAFNEFSSGSRHPAAVRRLVKMFYDRNEDKLRYLLMYGPATWDPRSLTTDRSNYLICYQVDISEKARESATNYCSDTYFGIVADGYRHNDIAYTASQISVGRIPVLNSSAGFDINKKIRQYLENPPTAREYLRALMLSDDGDLKSHTMQSVEALQALISGSPSMTAHRADISIYPLDNYKSRETSTIVRRVLGSGIGYFSYSGHGGPYSITGEDLYNTSLANTYNYNRWPMAMMSTCDAFPLDRHPNTLSEVMLFKQNGGMIGVIAACRSVYLEHNRGINTAVARVYGSAADGTMVGDVFRIARNELVTGSTQPGLGDNTMCYNLCGDPAMPIGVPTYRVSLDKVDDIPANNNIPSVRGRSKIKLSASILDRNGSTVNTFTGPAIIDIYDTPFERYSQNKADTAYCDEVLLVSLPAQVVNGKIETDISIPDASNVGGTNRVVITAIDDETKLTAGTMRSLISIAANNEEYGNDTDTSAPVIEQMYINTPDFINGSPVSSSFVLEAVIDPSETGLANHIWGVHTNSSLTLDSTTSYPHAISGLTPGNDGKVHLKLNIDQISDGEHSFTLTAVNNAGEMANATLDFKVVGSTLNGQLALDNDGPVRDTASFVLDGVTDSTKCHRLFIIDEKGNTIVSRKDCAFPFDWNLIDDKGNRVPDGRYKASALLEDDIQFGTTEPFEFVVIK